MTAILTFLGSYWKYIVPFIIGGLLFGGGAWKIQGMRLDSCKKNEAVCLTANAENAKTITAQKAEIKKVTESCSARIKSKDKAIRKLKEIDNLKPGEVSNATGNNTLGSNSGDSILDALAGMFKPNSKD